MLGGQLPPDFDPLVGVVIGEFRVEAFLAQGGMGRVYTARHRRLPSLQRAVKVLADSTKEADHAAFLKEAQAAANVTSINIVALHDFGFMPEGAPYLMMELLIGQTLEERLRAARVIPYMEALALTQQVLAALSAIHNAGLVHRDIKPANLFLVNDPSQQGVVVKVMDLGLAAARPKVQGETGVGTEKEENRAGTPVYASPEQFGDLVVGPASDVYSLGVVLYELVTGQVPFPEIPGESETSLPRRHIKEIPKHPRLFVTDLPDEIDKFMLSMLEKEPLKRPTVAAAQNQVKRLRERFRDQVREGPTQIKANPLEPPTRNTDQLTRMSTEEALAGLKRDRRPMAVAAIVAGLLLVGLGVAVRMQPDERKQEAPVPVMQVPPLEPKSPTVVVPPAAPQASSAEEKAELPPKPGAEAADDLAALPHALAEPAASKVPPQPRLANSAPTTIPAKDVVVRHTPACNFDSAFMDWGNRRRAILWQMADKEKPEIVNVDREVDEALALSDCRRTRTALARYAKLVGVPADE